MEENKADPGACAYFHREKKPPQCLSQNQLNIDIIICCNTSPFLASTALEMCAFPGVALEAMYSKISALSLGQEKKTSNCQHARVFFG